LKKPFTKKAGGVDQGVGPEFKALSSASTRKTKTTTTKPRTGRVAQVVECLPSNCEVPSLNSSTTPCKKYILLENEYI
jgi:hypothetical protein